MLIVREEEGERNSMLFKWKSRAHRGKETQTVGAEVNTRKKRVDKFILRAANHRQRAEERRREKKRIIVFFDFPPTVASFALVAQRGFWLNSAVQEELMVSFRGGRAEGRNLNALG